MVARSTSSTTISFGLVSIPVKLFTATSAQDVHFNQLHKKCGSRVKQKLHCPVDDEDVERADLVKGYEVAKNQYVQFSEEELRALEAERFSTLDLVEFVPESTVDFVYIERSQYIGPDKGGEKAFNLLTKAMRQMERIAVGRYWSRGKVQLVLLRPYKKGLILHQVYYANEVRSYDDVELGPDIAFSEGEQQLAAMLIDQLSQPSFDPAKYHDEYAERVHKAAEEKAAGQQITVSPEQPPAQIIDLFEALKQSLREKPKVPAEKAAANSSAAESSEALKGPTKAGERPKRGKKSQLG
ncbi:MAG TPA: Ku protein [Polyangiales bacterium]|jgi:DNA end-binding protein Ku|nr:Ku protein [Polyangiales bacterium]